MASHSTENPLALLSSPTLAYASQHACVLLVGPDAKSFLHRLSTNNVQSLKKGEGCLNVLANQKGRIVDLLHQVVIDDNHILLLASPGRGADICAWFDQYLFTEQVEIQDMSALHAPVWIFGAAAPSVVESWVAASTSAFAIRSFDFVNDAGDAVPSFLLVDSSIDSPSFDRLKQAVVFIDDPNFDAARIAACIPMAPNEINDAYNPLELGLRSAIHWAKGCYIGQEVISRLDTYQKLQRQLVRVYCQAADLNKLKPGQLIMQEGKPIGSLTSVATTFWPGHAVALAVVKFRPDVGGTIQPAIQTDLDLIPISFEINVITH